MIFISIYSNTSIGIVKNTGNTYGVKDLLDHGYTLEKLDGFRTSYLATDGTNKIIIKIISRDKYGKNETNVIHNIDIEQDDYSEIKHNNVYILDMCIDFIDRTYTSYLIPYNGETTININNEKAFKVNGKLL